MRKIIPNPLLIALLLLLGGCETVSWEHGGQPYTAKDGTFTVRLPTGWTFVEHPAGKIVATTDGFLVQGFIIGHRSLKEPMPSSKRIVRAGLSPFELAEAMTDDLRADHTLMNLKILENKPASLGGEPGFKLVASYRTADKLQIIATLYGCIRGQELYLLNYNAPARYYHERDRAAFEDTVNSFHFGKS